MAKGRIRQYVQNRRAQFDLKKTAKRAVLVGAGAVGAAIVNVVGDAKKFGAVTHLAIGLGAVAASDLLNLKEAGVAFSGAVAAHGFEKLAGESIAKALT